MQRYTTLISYLPKEEEEPSDAQPAAALHKRVILLGQAPYVDFDALFQASYARPAIPHVHAPA